MRRILTVAMAACAVSLGVPQAQAQTAQRFSIQGSGLYAGLYGNAFQDIKAGIGGEVQIRFTPGAWSIGGGVQYTVHNPSDSAAGVLSKAKLAGLFIEPRYVIDAGSEKFAPYLSARFAMSRMTITLDPAYAATLPTGFTLEIGKPTGPTINGGGGVLIRIGGRANLDAGVTYGYTKFNDITIKLTNTSNGQTVSTPVKLGSGTNIVVRLGLAIGIGG